MVELKSIAKSVTPDVRTDPATKAIADRLEAHQRRIYQSVGTVQTVMHVLNSKFDDAGKDDELTPLWSALLLATETPPVSLKRPSCSSLIHRRRALRVRDWPSSRARACTTQGRPLHGAAFFVAPCKENLHKKATFTDTSPPALRL
jgi:hypothetical protein